MTKFDVLKMKMVFDCKKKDDKMDFSLRVCKLPSNH